jgi:hypothetical protein
MYTFPFVSSKPVLFEVAEFSALEEYDLEETLHFREDKHLSSLSTEFEPYPTNPYYVVFDLDWKPTLIFHSECCGIDLWAMEFYEALTMKSVEKDHIDEHGSLILGTPQVPCSQDITSESHLLCASCFWQDHNHLLMLFCKMFRRMVVDAFVYCKHCRFCCCSVALTLQLEHHH